MANKPFDREIINVRERPFSSDINLSEYYADLSLRETIKNLITPRTSVSNADPNVSTTAKFLGASFKVVPTSPTSGSVLISKGIGFVGSSDVEVNINSVLGLNDTSEIKPLVLSENKTVAIPTSHPTLDRIDIIEVRSEYLSTDTTSRDIFNASTGVFNPTPVAKTFTWSLDQSLGYVTSPSNSTTAIGYKQGVAAASPSVPDTTSGYTKIAEIYVNSASSIFSQAAIADCRTIAGEYGKIKINGRVQLPEVSNPLETNTTILKPQMISLNSAASILVSCRCSNAIANPDDPQAGSKKEYEIIVVGKFSSITTNLNLIGYYEQIVGSDVQDWRVYLRSSEIATVGAGRQVAFRDFGSPSILMAPQQQCALISFSVEKCFSRTAFPAYVPETNTEPGIVDFFIELS